MGACCRFCRFWCAVSLILTLTGLTCEIPQDSAKFAGLVPRWHVIYNISMLRVVSFSMDWYWARKRGLGQVGRNIPIGLRAC